MDILLMNVFVIMHALYIYFDIKGIVPFITACMLSVVLLTILTKFVYRVIDSFEIRLICKDNNKEE